MVGTSLIILLAIAAVIWVLAEFQKIKHKIWAVILIALIVFGYLSFTIVLRDQNIDYTSPSGIIHAGRVYFSWLGSLFGNVKTMTSHAINLDWSAPEDIRIEEEK